MIKRRIGLLGLAMLSLACPAGGPRGGPGSGGGGDGTGIPDVGDAGTPARDGGGGEAVESGSLEVNWIHGSQDCGANTDPALQVHHYNNNVVILRQNKCLDFEGPFLYLIFGEDKALLVDTGATASADGFPLREQVEEIIAAKLGDRPRSEFELIVAHSHGHGDHTAADPQFAGEPGTTLIAATVAAVREAFAIVSWPEAEAMRDLGNRLISVIPIPGHERASIAFYDHKSGLLLTGDTLYPGRLYVAEWAEYRNSIARLNAFANRPGVTIRHVLGAHVEMSVTPGQDFPVGSTYQPGEHVLELGVEDLSELAAVLDEAGAVPQRIVRDDFIVTPR
jgi:hydroxyacylglutathione hydrolase